ncbi:hypothetical protein BpHYR1_047522 [Brachionus plicatilis]|uniref:Uncharacterized protein n=1 Tax=Brachionus plicatilis TaxID=10195 RepID=A0A3M7RK77_BRAPC|nr:hypothetical protein BpHYR1_047522 [Brachionus plicatilis]
MTLPKMIYRNKIFMMKNSNLPKKNSWDKFVSLKDLLNFKFLRKYKYVCLQPISISIFNLKLKPVLSFSKELRSALLFQSNFFKTIVKRFEVPKSEV